MRRIGNGSKSPTSNGESCTRCSLHETTEFVCIPGAGPDRVKVMVVGQAPDSQMTSFSHMFDDAAGSLLKSMMVQAGIDIDACFYTYAVHCSSPSNEKPKVASIRACRHWLFKEIEYYKPKYVLLLGAIPLKAVLGLDGIKKLRGKPIKQDGIIYLPTWNTKLVMPGQQPKQKSTMIADLRYFQKIIDHNGIPKGEELDIRIVDTELKLERALKWISSRRFLAFDTETSGLDQFTLAEKWITSIGLGNDQRQYVFPLHAKAWGNPWAGREQEVVDRIAEATSNVKLIAQNGKFDVLWTWVMYGWKPVIWFDTMLAHHLLDENSRHDLDFLSAHYLGAPNYDIPLTVKQGLTGTLQSHAKYLALDLSYTFRLRSIMWERLKDDPYLPKLFRRMVMRMSAMYTEAEYNGVYINRRNFARADRILGNRLKRIEKKLKKVADINWGSPDQVAEVLFKKMGLPVVEMTAKGKYSTKESVLNRLALDHDVAKLLLRHREVSKLYGTYIEGWRKRQVDGYLHPSIKIHGTVTGRPSCVDPNLQQTPRDTMIRAIVDAPPGYYCVEIDQSQVELRLTAEASGDREMKMAFLTGKDIHTQTVQRIFGIMQPTKEERKKGKAINFGFIYGMWWKKFRQYAFDNYGVEVSEEEAQSTREGFFQMFSGLEDWHDRQKRLASRLGYVRTFTGRKRRLPEIHGIDPNSWKLDGRQKEAQRQAINAPIQGFAAELTVMGALAIWEKWRNRGVKFFITVHDSAMFYVPVSIKPQEFIPDAKKLMENPPLFEDFGIRLTVPLVAEASVGPWGAGEEWKEAA